MKFTFFSGVIPLEKVKIMKSCGILILEKTENCLESVFCETVLKIFPKEFISNNTKCRKQKSKVLVK